MRISDWSSDVCSSDLKEIVVHPPVRARAGRAGKGLILRNLIGMMDFTMVDAAREIGRAHVRTPVTNAHLVCRLLLEKKKTQLIQHSIQHIYSNTYIKNKTK